MKKQLLFLLLLMTALVGASFAQERVLSGKVSDGAEPLPGVAVTITGTTKGTVTGIDGSFKLTAPESAKKLVFTMVGYKKQEVEIGNQTSFSIALEEDAKQLSEVIVTGYGQQLKQDVTGNIAKVGSKDIANIPVPSFESAIQGRAAGVNIVQGNGKLGSGIKMQIRGGSSISGSNQPLFVIDGMPIIAESQSSTASTLNPLSDIDFNDIESMEILKDASAAAIYGARAANGVVLITTKRGKQASKANFSLNVQNGWSEPTNLREFMNSDEYIQIFLEAGRNSSWSSENSVKSRLTRYSGKDPVTGKGLWEDPATRPNVDWQKEAFQAAPFQRYDFSANGGNERTRFYASASLQDQKGIIINNNLNRVSSRLNLDHKASQYFEMGLNLNLTRTFTTRVSDDNAFSTPMQIVAMAPIAPIRDAAGKLRDNIPYYNPLIEKEGSHFKTTVYRSISNGYLQFSPIKDLKIRAEGGVDLLNQNEERFWGIATEVGRSSNGAAQARTVQILNMNSNLFATYSKVFGQHNFDLTGGTSFQKAIRYSTNVEGQNFPSDSFKHIQSAGTISAGSSFRTAYAFLSYFGRANYKFMDRYLVSASLRSDGSSRFAENNRFGMFPSASLGWILSEEDFLKGNKAVSFLKLRGSYGITGNAEVANFGYMGLYGANRYGDAAGIAFTQLSNPDLTWETTAQADLGIDFGFLNDRITGEVDVYQKNTSDLLLDVPLMGTSGFTSQLRNIGAMQNRGIELVINANILTGGFKWNVSANWSANRNEVTQLTSSDPDERIIPGSRFMNIAQVGHPIGVFYGVEYAGVNEKNGDALFFVNRNLTDAEKKDYVLKDGRYATNNYDDAERVHLGSPLPDFTYGLTNTFSYKNFDLSILLQGVQGNMIYNGGGGYMSTAGDWYDNQTKDQLNYWTPTNTQTDIPQPRLGDGNGIQTSSRYLQDGSYLRLKNLTFGYTLPKDLVKKAGLSNVRVYFNGQNLLTFTKYDGWDPEVNTDYLLNPIFNGNDFYSAPQARTYTFGLNVGF